jgi:phage head maturation protease
MTRRPHDTVIELDDQITKHAPAGYIKSVDDRSVTIVACHEQVDADGELVRVRGIDLSRYLRNPVLLPHHNYQAAGVATVRHLRVEPLDGALALVGEAVFPNRPQSDEALADIRAGLVQGVSIGFRSLEQGPPVLAGQKGVTHTKTQLLEISLVSLPSCPTCLVSTKSCACRGSLREKWNQSLATIRAVTGKEQPMRHQNDVVLNILDEAPWPKRRGPKTKAEADAPWFRHQHKRELIQQLQDRAVPNALGRTLDVPDPEAPHGCWRIPVAHTDHAAEDLVRRLIALL